jgi:acyl-CoA synthetase (AMP-forming)/AMP-acid ligase II
MLSHGSLLHNVESCRICLQTVAEDRFAVLLPMFHSYMLTVGLLGALEIARAFVAEYGADTTALLLATVAWLLTTRVWRSIYPRGHVPDTRFAGTT